MAKYGRATHGMHGWKMERLPPEGHSFWQDTPRIWTSVPAQQPQPGPQPGNLNYEMQTDANILANWLAQRLNKEHCIYPSPFLPFLTGEVWHLYVDGACPSNRGLAETKKKSLLCTVACHGPSWPVMIFVADVAVPRKRPEHASSCGLGCGHLLACVVTSA